MGIWLLHTPYRQQLALMSRYYTGCAKMQHQHKDYFYQQSKNPTCVLRSIKPISHVIPQQQLHRKFQHQQHHSSAPVEEVLIKARFPRNVSLSISLRLKSVPIDPHKLKCFQELQLTSGPLGPPIQEASVNEWAIGPGILASDLVRWPWDWLLCAQEVCDRIATVTGSYSIDEITLSDCIRV